MEINQITEQIIGAAINVHRVLGPGLSIRLLINFNVRKLTDGLKRIANKYNEK